MEYAGLIIILILIGIRPEYMFLLFYVFANWSRKTGRDKGFEREMERIRDEIAARGG